MDHPDNPELYFYPAPEENPYGHPEMPLLQSGELAQAQHIDPEMDPAHLEALWHMGSTVTQRYCLAAIAGNQYEENVYHFWDIDPTLNNTIYFSPNLLDGHAPVFGLKVLRGALFINPEIAVHPLSRWVLRVEGCGSIKKAGLKMVVWRPTMVNFSAAVYAPHLGFSKPQWVELTSPLDAAAIAHHEIDHLQNRRDATNSLITRIVNPFTLDDPAFDDIDPSALARLAEHINDYDKNSQWLVPDGDRLIVTTINGQPIREYIRQYPT